MCIKTEALEGQDSYDDATGQIKIPESANWGGEGCPRSNYSVSPLDALEEIGAGPED